MEESIVQTSGFHMLAKPSGPICNLDCHYCFYTEKETLFFRYAFISNVNVYAETLQEIHQTIY